MVARTISRVRSLRLIWFEKPVGRFVRLCLYWLPLQLASRGLLHLWNKETITRAQFKEDVFCTAFVVLIMSAGILLFGKYNRFFRS